MLKTNRTLPEV